METVKIKLKLATFGKNRGDIVELDRDIYFREFRSRGDIIIEENEEIKEQDNDNEKDIDKKENKKNVTSTNKTKRRTRKKKDNNNN